MSTRFVSLLLLQASTQGASELVLVVRKLDQVSFGFRPSQHTPGSLEPTKQQHTNQRQRYPKNARVAWWYTTSISTAPAHPQQNYRMIRFFREVWKGKAPKSKHAAEILLSWMSDRVTYSAPPDPVNTQAYHQACRTTAPCTGRTHRPCCSPTNQHP